MWTSKLYKPYFSIVGFFYITWTHLVPGNQGILQALSYLWLDPVQHIGNKNKAIKSLEIHYSSVDLFQYLSMIFVCSNSHEFIKAYSFDKNWAAL